MEKIIENIIKKLAKGIMFDSHLIINILIKDYSDDYLSFASRNQASTYITEYVHSEIAKIISSFDGKLVEKQKQNSMSYNIRGNISKCALWLKK